MSIYNDLSSGLPCTVFSTINRFNDINSDDMQYGDLDETQLKLLGLNDISARVDPYRLLRFDNAYHMYHEPSDLGMNSHRYSSGTPITHHECIDILFDEMKELSSMFALRGLYSHLIGEMIDHFRYGNGQSFQSTALNKAFETLIKESSLDSPLVKIENAIRKKMSQRINVGTEPPLYFLIQSELSTSRLPKFTRHEDNFNGLAITVHDIHAQEIRLLYLKKYFFAWESMVSFKAQDHFGLDKTDITHSVYSKFRFFRIWFFLQRHKDFAFKPFFTNFRANICIGKRL